MSVSLSSVIYPITTGFILAFPLSLFVDYFFQYWECGSRRLAFFYNPTKYIVVELVIYFYDKYIYLTEYNIYEPCPFMVTLQHSVKTLFSEVTQTGRFIPSAGLYN